MTSQLLAQAFAEDRELREEFALVRLAAYEEAEKATRGAMVNRKGRRKGIDPFRLFTGNTTYARCYASEELLEHWRTHPRPTFAEYERTARTEPF